MRKLSTLLIVCCMGFSSLMAQITIDEGDMPVGGYAATLSIADSLFQPDLQTQGANVTWDFSALSPASQRKDTFVSVNSAPLLIRLLFASANVARLQNTPDSLGGAALSDAYQFFRRRSTQYENQGIGGTVSGVPIGLKNNPVDVVYRFPLSYTDSDSSEALAKLDISNLFYIEREVKRWNEVDSWGQITTPYGTFDALRVKTTIEESDSIATDTLQFRIDIPTRREYKWLTKEERVPILTVNTVVIANNDLSAVVSYVDSVRDTGTTTSVGRPLEEIAKLYPNPSQDQVRVQFEEKIGQNAQLEIYDLQGRLVKKKALSQGLSTISLLSIPTGVYSVVIRRGTQIYQGKLLRE